MRNKVNTRQEKAMDIKKIQSLGIFYFILKGPLCVGKSLKKEKWIYSLSPNQKVNDRKTGNERVVVKGLEKDPPLSVCADFRQTDNLIILESEDKSSPRTHFQDFCPESAGTPWR